MPGGRINGAVQVVGSFVLLLMLAIAALGCSKPGSEYVGKWQNTKNQNDQFEIVRNGDNFLVTKTRKGALNKQSSNTVTCVLKDGLLQSTGTFGTATLTYVKATDRITTPGLFGANVEYERVK